MKNWNYPRNKLISVRVNEELYDTANKILKDKWAWNQNSVADLLEDALKQYIEKNTKTNKR